MEKGVRIVADFFTCALGIRDAERGSITQDDFIWAANSRSDDVRNTSVGYELSINVGLSTARKRG
jgi:hypothetical protein